MGESYRHTREYAAWANAKYRCRTSTAPAWKHYGGRGITFSPAWDDFVSFLLDMGWCPPGHSLDRIDNNRGYEPGNCRWVTTKQQSRNTRANVLWTHNGETLSVAEWAERIGCAYRTLRRRVDELGWPVSEALTRPIRPKSDSRWNHGA